MRPSTADLSRSLEMTFHTALMGWRASPRVVRLLRTIVESCEEKGTAEACQDDIVLKQPFHDAIQALGRAAVRRSVPARTDVRGAYKPLTCRTRQLAPTSP